MNILAFKVVLNHANVNNSLQLNYYTCFEFSICSISKIKQNKKIPDSLLEEGGICIFSQQKKTLNIKTWNNIELF